MRYRIERIEGQHCHFVNGRKELLAYLKHTQAGTITDIRKIYQSGVTDSVMELYRGRQALCAWVQGRQRTAGVKGQRPLAG